MMRLIKDLFSGFMISLVSLIGFSCIAILMNRQKLSQFDQGLISSIQGFESPALTLVMKFFTLIGSFPSVFVIAIFASLFSSLFSLLCLKASNGAYLIWFRCYWNAHY